MDDHSTALHAAESSSRSHKGQHHRRRSSRPHETSEDDERSVPTSAYDDDYFGEIIDGDRANHGEPVQSTTSDAAFRLVTALRVPSPTQLPARAAAGSSNDMGDVIEL